MYIDFNETTMDALDNLLMDALEAGFEPADAYPDWNGGSMRLLTQQEIVDIFLDLTDVDEDALVRLYQTAADYLDN